MVEYRNAATSSSKNTKPQWQGSSIAGNSGALRNSTAVRRKPSAQPMSRVHMHNNFTSPTQPRVQRMRPTNRQDKHIADPAPFEYDHVPAFHGSAGLAMHGVSRRAPHEITSPFKSSHYGLDESSYAAETAAARPAGRVADASPVYSRSNASEFTEHCALKPYTRQQLSEDNQIQSSGHEVNMLKRKFERLVPGSLSEQDSRGRVERVYSKDSSVTDMRQNSMKSTETQMLGGRQQHEEQARARTTTRLTYARTPEERGIVYDDLIGSFTQEEMDLFSPWIDREKVGLL